MIQTKQLFCIRETRTLGALTVDVDGGGLTAILGATFDWPRYSSID
jgi:hypothetical protein